MTEVVFKFVNPDLSASERDMLRPKRQSDFASGFDMVAANREDIFLKPGERHLIPTGIAIALERGFEAQIRSRSGLSFKNGLIVLNAPGTIDADYRGEIKIILANTSGTEFCVTFGMRVAQMVIAPVVLPELREVTDLSESKRGELGFGSTGLTAARACP